MPHLKKSSNITYHLSTTYRAESSVLSVKISKAIKTTASFNMPSPKTILNKSGNLCESIKAYGANVSAFDKTTAKTKQ